MSHAQPNMVCAGVDNKSQSSAADVGMFTVRTLLRTVPAALPGVVFLSGGQSEVEASRNLNAINVQPRAKTWHLTFSYGRALQASCLDAWRGDKANVAKAQAAFLKRAKQNSLAQLGHYVDEEDSAKLYVRDYKY